jgi:predicted restriction endonuclease
MNHSDMKGTNNSNFRGWSARNAARANAIRKLGKACAICGFNIVVHVHHIIPAAAGGSNKIENLIVLCPNHHEMADRGMISPVELIKLNPFSTVQLLENQHQTHQPSLIQHSSTDTMI